MSAHRTTRQTWLLTLALLGMLAVLLGGSARALAGTGYVPGGSFGAEGSGAGQFNEPSGIAVNHASGDVYVYDAGNRRVEWFSASGSKFEGQFNGSASPTGQFTPATILSEEAQHGTLFNLAVDNDSSSPSAGDVYVVDPGHNVIDKFSAAGVYLSQLTGFAAPIFGVTVHASGNLWVAEAGKEENGENIGPVQEFDDALANKHLVEVKPGKLRSPGIAVDSEENLYLLKGNPDVAKFAHDGSFIGEVTSCSCDTALAVNSGTNELLVDQGTTIARYGPLGTPFEETLEGISSSQGIAVNSTTETLYATQHTAASVAVFDLVPLPEVTTGSANATRTSAKVEGEVNPDGEEITACEFEYGTSSSLTHTAPCTPAPGSGTSPVPVSADIAGLAAQTTYHYRLVAHNTHGPRTGADHEFTTPVAVEGLLTGQASEVHGTTATLGGSLEPNGFDTHYVFEYGPTESYGATTTTTDAGSAKGTAPASSEVSALVPNEVYHYRIVAENTFGETTGEDKTFTTAVLAPVISGSPSTSFIGSQSAVLGAALNPNHLTTHYHFEYGACPSLAGCPNVQRTADEASSVYGIIGTTQELSGLAPATIYSYRLVASNRHLARCEGGSPIEEEGGIVGCEGGAAVYEGGEVIGAQSTFTTGSAPSLAATTGPTALLTPTSAVISGTVDPDGRQATYTFELGVYEGTGTRYGVVFSATAGSSTTPIEETLPLSGLQPGSTYAYRIVIHSGYGEATGVTGTFTTPGLLSILLPPTTLPQLAIPNITFPPVATTVTTKPKPKAKTPAQKRKRALNACKRRPKAKRAGCEKSARKR